MKNCSTQTVTFTVKDGAGNDANAIANARVNVSGAMLKTNVSGQAVFNLRSGSYDVKVTASGFKAVTDSVTVASSAVTKNIVLTANS